MTNRTLATAGSIAVIAVGISLMASSQRAGLDESRHSASLASTPGVAAEVLAFEREIEAAVVRGDVAFVDAASAPTFTFTHGDGWTSGGEPLRVDNRADWLATVANAPPLRRTCGRCDVTRIGSAAGRSHSQRVADCPPD